MSGSSSNLINDGSLSVLFGIGDGFLFNLGICNELKRLSRSCIYVSNVLNELLNSSLYRKRST